MEKVRKLQKSLNVTIKAWAFISDVSYNLILQRNQVTNQLEIIMDNFNCVMEIQFSNLCGNPAFVRRVGCVWPHVRAQDEWLRVGMCMENCRVPG